MIHCTGSGVASLKLTHQTQPKVAAKLVQFPFRWWNLTVRWYLNNLRWSAKGKRPGQRSVLAALAKRNAARWDSISSTSTPASAAVGAAAVGQDGHFVGLGVLLSAAWAPPAVQCINREGRCLTRHAEHDHARFVLHVVDAMGESHAIGVGEEVVGVDLASLALPGSSRVPEVAGELAFCRQR